MIMEKKSICFNSEIFKIGDFQGKEKKVFKAVSFYFEKAP